MKFETLACIFGSSAFLAVGVQASTWTIDPGHSAVNFSVRHMMVTNVTGSINEFDGKLDLDEKDIAKSKITANLKPESIDTKEKKRDEHLRSPDFFDVAKYPKMTFVSKKIEKSGPDTLKVTGDLTMHGVTKEVVLDVEGPSEAIKTPQGGMVRGLSAKTTINRKDFGITWNKTIDAPDSLAGKVGKFAVGEEVKIAIDLQLKGESKATH